MYATVIMQLLLITLYHIALHCFFYLCNSAIVTCDVAFLEHNRAFQRTQKSFYKHNRASGRAKTVYRQFIEHSK